MTKIETLDLSHPGLLKDVEAWFATHYDGCFAGLQDMLQATHHECVAISTLSSYHKLRVVPEKERHAKSLEQERRAYAEEKARAHVLIEESAKDPASDASEILQSIVQSSLIRRRMEFDSADLLKLIAEERKRQELEQRQQRIEIEKGKLQVALQNAETAAKEATAKIEAQKRAIKEATDEAEKKLGKGESITIEDINRIRKRTFGLPALDKVAARTTDPDVSATVD